jgi:hypothetical protein
MSILVSVSLNSQPLIAQTIDLTLIPTSLGLGLRVRCHTAGRVRSSHNVASDLPQQFAVCEVDAVRWARIEQ